MTLTVGDGVVPLTFGESITPFSDTPGRYENNTGDVSSVVNMHLKIADPVNHPPHYTMHPSGIECIQVTEHMGFNIGNAVKYLWRCDLKNGVEDLKKAAWYINREIERRQKL